MAKQRRRAARSPKPAARTKSEPVPERVEIPVTDPTEIARLERIFGFAEDEVATNATSRRWHDGVRRAPEPNRSGRGEELLVAPPRSAIGALARYVSSAETRNYQPVNITFALLEPLPKDQARSVKRKRDRHSLQVNLALKEFDEWVETSLRQETQLVVATK